MSNLGVTLVKLAVMAGGAVAGALLVRWYDDLARMQAQTRSHHDKTRYERGLAPVEEKQK